MRLCIYVVAYKSFLLIFISILHLSLFMYLCGCIYAIVFLGVYLGVRVPVCVYVRLYVSVGVSYVYISPSVYGYVLIYIVFM